MELDLIVLGLGGVGSAALLHAARRGARVLGLEQFPLVHDRGSSHGQTRIFRLAYYEHPAFVPLLRASLDLWRGLEADTGAALLDQVGLLQVGPPDGEVVPGVLASAAAHGLTVERFSPRAAEREFPGFRVPEGHVALHEREAGLLRVEACVRAHLDRARALGARIEAETPALGWRARGDGVEVRTTRGTFAARSLVIAAGPWSGSVMADLGLPLRLVRKTQLWFPSRDLAYHAGSGGPCFLYELPEGLFYGLPWIDDLGVKVAEHSGGETIATPAGPGAPPSPAEEAAVEAFRRRWMPALGGPRGAASPCTYTMTPDALFVVDTHPEHPAVHLAAGLSGHGFKLTPALGEALAERALEGRSRHDVGFLSLARFARPA